MENRRMEIRIFVVLITICVVTAPIGGAVALAPSSGAVNGDLIIATDNSDPDPKEDNLNAGQTYTFEFTLLYELEEGESGTIEFFLGPDGKTKTKEVTGSGELEETKITYEDVTVPREREGEGFPLSAVLYDSNGDFVEGDDETYEVTAPGDPPEINGADPSGDETVVVEKGETRTFSVDATDPDGDELDYTWRLRKIGNEFEEVGSGSSHSQTFDVELDDGATAYKLEVEVTDPYHSVTYDWLIDVQKENNDRPPSVARVTPDSSEFVADSGDEVEFEIEATDQDDDLDRVDWYVNGEKEVTRNFGGGVTQTDTRTFSFDTDGPHSVRAEVIDSNGNTDSVSWDSSLSDLQVTDIELDPADPVTGEPVDFRMTIKNTGEKTANTVESEVRVDGELVAVPPTKTLEPGESVKTSWTGSYEFEEGSHTVTAIVDPDGNIPETSTDNNEQNRTLAVGVEPPATELNIDVIRINDKKPVDGAFEIGSGTINSIEFEITGPNGETISPDSLQLEFFGSFDSEINRVSNDRFKAEEIGAFAPPTGFSNVDVRYPDGEASQTIQVPIVSEADSLDKPISEWKTTGETHTVIVDNKEYTAIEVYPDGGGKTSWLIVEQDGTIVEDSETYQRAAQTAHVSSLHARSGDSRAELLRDLSEEYNQSLEDISYAEKLLFVRDGAAKLIGYIGFVKSGGTSKIKSKIAKEAAKEVAKEFLKEVITEQVGEITTDDGQVITRALLEDDPVKAFDNMMEEKAETEIEEAGEAAAEGANILEQKGESEPWTYDEAMRYYKVEKKATVDGRLYLHMRDNMLPNSDALSQLQDVSLAALDGVSGPDSEIDPSSAARMVELVNEGEIGYLADAMDETSDLRAVRMGMKESFTTEADRVRTDVSAQYGDSTVLVEEKERGDAPRASITIVDEPSGAYTTGEEVKTTVEVTNLGENPREFFVGYSTVVELDDERQFFDNEGQTGKFVSIAPDETKEVTVSWKATPGTPVVDDYGIITAVWSDFPEAAQTQRLDDERRSDVFEIKENSNIKLQSVNVPAEEFKSGEFVDIRAVYENTGGASGDTIVEIRVDGEVVDRNSIIVDPGEKSVGIGRSFEDPGEYELVVSDGDATVTETVTVTAQDVPETDPANFEVSNLDAPDSATQGDATDVSADVTNDGGQEATQIVQFRLDTDDNGTLESGDVLADQEVILDAGETQTITFEDIDTSGIEPGEYDHGVFTDNDSATATLTIDSQDSFNVANFDRNDDDRIDFDDMRFALQAFNNEQITFDQFRRVLSAYNTQESV